MARPDDVPDDVWKAATAVWFTDIGFANDRFGSLECIARAILAERERCAKIADEREAICADAVSKIEAGELYKGIPTARATEECARLEASHIARLIRGEAGAPSPSLVAGERRKSQP